MKSLVIAAVIISVLAVAGTWIGVRRAQAQTSISVLYPVVPQVTTLGMVGLAPGQTARLYALNLQGIPAQRVLNLPQCNMTLSFVDDQGATLKTAAMNVGPGTAGHLDLAHDDVTSDSTRLQIHGVVQQTGGLTIPAATPARPTVLGCEAVPTLEIFDTATGITTAVLESAKAVGTLVPVVGTPVPTP